MFIKHIPQQPELNKYVLRLINYFKEHKFHIEIDYSELESHAEEALTALYDARANGSSVDEAEEIANEVLFQNIGESEYEVIINLIRENFADIIDIEDVEWQEFWIPKILESDINIFEDCEVLKYGISAADLDINRDAIIGRLTDFFQRIWPTTD